jgi:hypothetical protein
MQVRAIGPPGFGKIGRSVWFLLRRVLEMAEDSQIAYGIAGLLVMSARERAAA